jgi:hypothetical protein
MKIRLVTGTQELVHEDTIPPFNEDPEVILWGLRTFKRHLVDGDTTVYAECFAYHLP